MRFGQLSGYVAAVGFAIVFAAPQDAEARSRTPAAASVHGNVKAMKAGMAAHRGGGARYAGRGYGRLQCVPFARENTGIELSGNASQWWSNAEGVYQRGARPEVGSVLNFRANGRMRMGHVAVVTNVVNPRNVEIDHANWSGPGVGRGGISRDITVVDVSERNDWSAVRVALGHTGEFGSVYPTYGFIYDRPDAGTMVANNGTASVPVLNAPPRDLRPARDRIQFAATSENEEVAEAEDDAQPRFRRSTSRHHARTAAGKHGAAPAVTRVKSGAASAPGAHKHRAHRT